MAEQVITLIGRPPIPPAELILATAAVTPEAPVAPASLGNPSGSMTTSGLLVALVLALARFAEPIATVPARATAPVALNVRARTTDLFNDI
jgi:hypothetical protein